MVMMEVRRWLHLQPPFTDFVPVEKEADGDGNHRPDARSKQCGKTPQQPFQEDAPKRRLVAVATTQYFQLLDNRGPELLLVHLYRHGSRRIVDRGVGRLCRSDYTCRSRGNRSDRGGQIGRSERKLVGYRWCTAPVVASLCPHIACNAKTLFIDHP